MSRRKPRHLSSEEKELWTKVADTTTALHPKAAKPVDPAKVLNSKPRKKPTTLQTDFVIGQLAKSKPRPNSLAPSITDSLQTSPVQMDAKSFGKMKRGKLVPEGRIDLHGMTLDQAHPALVNFILGSHSAGKRLVLVITGKGKVKPGDGPIPARIGVLKHQVPQWLQQQPVKPLVLQLAQASAKHGGSGAYYIYLRRQR